MSKRFFGTLMFLVLYCGTIFSQYMGYGPPAIIPNQPMENHGFYSVDLQDLSIIINIPIRSKPGFSASFNGAINRIGWGSPYSTSHITPIAVNLTSGGVINGLLSGNTSFQSGAVTQVKCPNGTTNTYVWTNWYFFDGNGTAHYLPSGTYIDNESALGTGASCYQSSVTAQTTDHAFSITIETGSSSYVFVSYNNGGGVRTTLNHPTSSQSQFVAAAFTQYLDRNGDTTSATSSGFTSYTDIMGLTALTSTGVGSAPTFTWPNASGGTSSLGITSAPYYRKTSYGCTNELGYFADILDTTPVQLMSGVNFPDGSTLGITYEPNGSGYTTGQLARIIHEDIARAQSLVPSGV
jgi:hypothetical protein